MSSKKLKAVSLNLDGKQPVRPSTHGNLCGTSLTSLSTHENNRFPTSSLPKDYLPTMRDLNEDGDDVDYDENDNVDEDSDSDDGEEECDQWNDAASNDELGYEVMLDVIDESGYRRTRGITSLGNIWNLPKGQRVTLEFNKKFQIVGDNSTVFPRFLGTMAQKSDYCPLNYLTWPKVPKEYKKHCLMTIEAKCAKNKLSRSFQKDVHTLGGKTYARLAHELEKKDDRAQTRTDLYIQSKKRKNGESVTEIAVENIEEMERLMLQQDVNPIQRVQGQIVYQQGSSSSKSTQPTYSELMERHLNDVNTIHTLQEKILQFEAERAEEKKQRAEEQKQILDRLQTIEQLLPGVLSNLGGGPRNDISPSLQTKSSCASRFQEEDDQGAQK